MFLLFLEVPRGTFFFFFFVGNEGQVRYQPPKFLEPKPAIQTAPPPQAAAVAHFFGHLHRRSAAGWAKFATVHGAGPD